MPYNRKKTASQDLTVIANRGKEYRVAFDDKGDAFVVQVITRGTYRMVWAQSRDKNSITANCAINAAITKLGAWR
jgi:uncharacterized protein with GYD domain